MGHHPGVVSCRGFHATREPAQKRRKILILITSSCLVFVSLPLVRQYNHSICVLIKFDNPGRLLQPVTALSRVLQLGMAGCAAFVRPGDRKPLHGGTILGGLEQTL